jgi:hypothetical protein
MIDLSTLKLLDGPRDDRGKPLRGGRIAARKYVRNAQYGSLYLPPAYNVDNSRSLWEPIAFSARAIDFLCDGIGLERDPNDKNALPYREALRTLQCVLVTPPDRGAVLPDCAGEREVFVLWADEVIRVHPYAIAQEKCTACDGIDGKHQSDCQNMAWA